jgi:2-polyprenyl-3-methyl-5-hydroxy-6-metoxy-1,4-benzoquinol methylase
MDNLLSKDDNYYTNTRQDMLKFIDVKISRILEIGCGEGNFATNFTDVEYWGVEPVTQHAKAAEQKGLKILNGLYEDVEDKIPNAYFDLIVCNDVIEHMIDPRLFLKNIRNKLAPSGKMIVSVPNLLNAYTLYNLLIKRDFKYENAGVLDYTHLHLFTKKSFINMATEFDWEIEKYAPLPPPPYKPFKNIILNFVKFFIPEIKSQQIGFRLTPSNHIKK